MVLVGENGGVSSMGGDLHFGPFLLKRFTLLSFNGFNSQTWLYTQLFLQHIS